MVTVSALQSSLNRSRSSSNAATHSRERSATLASTSTTHTTGTMSTLTPSSEAPPAIIGTGGGGGIGVGIGVSSVGNGLGGTGVAGHGSGGGAAALASGTNGILPPPPVPAMQGPGRGVPATSKEAGQNPDAIYQSIQEASAKRISSLDYLKKTHEPRVFWFNTLLYTQPDIARLPSFSAPRLSRRATNFLLLGVSLPSVVDLNTQSPTDYLQALNELLLEFEDYERQHPIDGSATGSLSRAKFGTMFKRNNTSGGKRRTSSAADIGLPMHNSDPQELKNLLGQSGTSGGAATGAGQAGTNGVPPLPPGVAAPGRDVIPGGELAAGEDLSWLRTPSIPFEPDFFEVFVTLCDILIECYSRIASLVSSPTVCAPETGEIFIKADSKIRRVVFEGIIKEFVEHTRAGVKNEVAGIGKIILGGLM